ncbi:MAG: type II toxin-antitoxin system VapC family toxin [Acidobacteriota bacterium]
MVIDTSALVAILLDEPGAEQIEDAISEDPVRLVSAASVLETSIIVEARFGEPGGRELDLLIHRAAIDIAPVTADQIEVARQAFRSFGRGRHPAALNFGDCFSYALSKTSGEPLLFKGDDFAQTDAESVF